MLLSLIAAVLFLLPRLLAGVNIFSFWRQKRIPKEEPRWAKRLGLYHLFPDHGPAREPGGRGRHKRGEHGEVGEGRPSDPVGKGHQHRADGYAECAAKLGRYAACSTGMDDFIFG